VSARLFNIISITPLSNSVGADPFLRTLQLPTSVEPKVSSRCSQEPQLISVLGQINPIHTPHPVTLNILSL
jgi:hypothetical protein